MLFRVLLGFIALNPRRMLLYLTKIKYHRRTSKRKFDDFLKCYCHDISYDQIYIAVIESLLLNIAFLGFSNDTATLSRTIGIV